MEFLGEKMLDSFLNVVNQVWNDGLYGIGITELIVSIVILFGGFIVRGVFIARVFKWLEKLSDQTESEADDAVLETLEKTFGLSSYHNCFVCDNTLLYL